MIGFSRTIFTAILDTAAFDTKNFNNAIEEKDIEDVHFVDGMENWKTK